MFLKHILLGFLGLAFGGAVAAGTFAFVIVIGVVPRMIGKCNRAVSTLGFEQAIILGGIMGLTGIWWAFSSTSISKGIIFVITFFWITRNNR